MPAGEKATLAYQLVRAGAAELLDGGRLRHQVVLRPQATIWPDEATVVVAPPGGWEFTGLPAGARPTGASATCGNDRKGGARLEVKRR